MREVLRQHRLFVLLIAIQAASLGAGLWAQQKFLAANDQWQREQAGEASAMPVVSPAVAEGRMIVHGLAFLWITVLQSVAAWVIVSRMRGQQERRQAASQEEALLKAKELLKTRDAVVFGLAKLAESRDPDTGMHLERIALYSTRLASALRKHRKYRDIVTTSFVNTIGISSALHDIGKVGVEDAVLLKPGKLTTDERYRIQVHAKLGGECIRQIERRLGNSNFLEMAREIALYHHERWDGQGYPDGLQGEAIPLAARIVSIADVYDALRVKRVYKDARPHDQVSEIIRSEAGRQFDPELVEVFLTIHQQFRDIAERFGEVPGAQRPRPPQPSRGLTMTPNEERLLTTTIGEPAQVAEPAAVSGA
jgi:HD-GYP domain-containing protein (c-di-GMP phosphodiesterase class II)